MLSYLSNDTTTTTEEGENKTLIRPRFVLPRTSTKTTDSRPRWSHTPVVHAMLTGNTMNTCQDMERMLTECIDSHSNAYICEAAARQFALCIPLQIGD
jgi:hypothetical protein